MIFSAVELNVVYYFKGVSLTINISFTSIFIRKPSTSGYLTTCRIGKSINFDARIDKYLLS